MFTGITTDIGEVVAVRLRGEGLHRLKIACRYDRASIVEGASIACAGVCLTVVGVGVEDGHTWFAADAAAETLRITTVGDWRHGTKINLERAKYWVGKGAQPSDTVASFLKKAAKAAPAPAA